MRKTLSFLKEFPGYREDWGQNEGPRTGPFLLLSPRPGPVLGACVPCLTFCAPVLPTCEFPPQLCLALSRTWEERRLFLAPDRSSSCVTTSLSSSLPRRAQPLWARLRKGRAENPALPPPSSGSRQLLNPQGLSSPVMEATKWEGRRMNSRWRGQGVETCPQIKVSPDPGHA